MSPAKNMLPKALKEKEVLCRKALHAIAKEKCLTENIVLHGGGALHFIYSSPRYSLDLDFSVRDPKTSITGIIEKIMDVLSMHFETRYQKNGKGNSSMIRAIERVKIREKGGSLVVNIELGNDISIDATATKGEFNPLLVESAAELYTDKIIASLGRMAMRDTIKGTDLFDLFFIKNVLQQPLMRELLIKKAGHYGFFGWKKENALSIISYITSAENKPKIIKDVKSTMMPDVARIYNPDDNFFKEAVLIFTEICQLLE